MPSNPHPSKAERREAARAAALAIKQKQEAADRRAKIITATILGVVLAALLGVMIFLFVRNGANEAANTVEDVPLADVATAPAGVTDDGGIPLGADGAVGGTATDGVPTVAVYVDYMCPYCGQFEIVNQAGLEEMITGGTANVVVHPISLLDRVSQGTEFSTRAATASAWVADRAPEQWQAFHQALFANQPVENTPGLSDEELAQQAKDAGVPADVADAIASGEARRTFGQWVHSASRHALDEAGVQGTPAVMIDGEPWTGDWTDPAALPQAVAAASR